jgi:hypothetical protein
MVGEKHVPLKQFGVGVLDSCTYNGDYPLCCTRGGGMGIGLATSLTDPYWKFGSYHTAVCQFVFCDGSVQGLPHAITSDTLGLLLCINDGQSIPGDAW